MSSSSILPLVCFGESYQVNEPQHENFKITLLKLARDFRQNQDMVHYKQNQPGSAFNLVLLTESKATENLRSFDCAPLLNGKMARQCIPQR